MPMHLAKRLVSYGFRKLFRIFAKLPRQSRVIVFESFHGKQYSCNPRAIYEYMKDQYPEYTFYWSLNKASIPLVSHHQLPVLPRFTLKWIYTMATAKYWVINTRMPRWMQKPEGTIFLQTWHGTPLKKLGLDIEDVKMPGTTTELYRKNFIDETSRWDYLIAPNSYSRDIFRTAFAYNGTMIESGYPRNDVLYTQNQPSAVSFLKSQMGLPGDKKVLLYAPTWRDDEYIEVGKYSFHLKLDLGEMRKQLGDDYILLLRMHYLIAEHMDLTGYEDFAYNMSGYEDIRDLYLVSDVLITDYSSVYFDYANLKRPVIFYTYDLEKYRDSLRGFYVDFERTAPGPLVTTTEQVIAEVQSIPVSHQIDEFNERYCAWEDGSATERVVHEVFGSPSAPKPIV